MKNITIRKFKQFYKFGYEESVHFKFYYLGWFSILIEKNKE